MSAWKNLLISPQTPILETVRILDGGGAQIGLVADGNRRLLGTITDGDIRRGILRGLPLSEPASLVMNPKPQTATLGTSEQSLLDTMTSLGIRHIPLLDGEGVIVGLVSMSALVGQRSLRSNWVVLMAGGLGKRLLPLTQDTPKPLLHVGGRPILETIIENFLAQGFHHFYISVNYKAHMVTEHFGDGNRWGAEIRYLREDKPLGTAGCLRLIEENLKAPLIVMNGDLLTKVNFGHMLDYHVENEAKVTMGVREYDFQVPFGVVHIENRRVRIIEEKPQHKFFVNAGIYVLDPDVMTYAPPEGPVDMPDLINSIAGDNQPVSVFPLREYWVDIGRIDDFHQARTEFDREFR